MKRRVISMLLVLVMALGLGAPAMADEGSGTAEAALAGAGEPAEQREEAAEPTAEDGNWWGTPIEGIEGDTSGLISFDPDGGWTIFVNIKLGYSLSLVESELEIWANYYVYDLTNGTPLYRRYWITAYSVQSMQSLGKIRIDYTGETAPQNLVRVKYNDPNNIIRGTRYNRGPESGTGVNYVVPGDSFVMEIDDDYIVKEDWEIDDDDWENDLGNRENYYNAEKGEPIFCKIDVSGGYVSFLRNADSIFTGVWRYGVYADENASEVVVSITVDEPTPSTPTPSTPTPSTPTPSTPTPSTPTPSTPTPSTPTPSTPTPSTPTPSTPTPSTPTPSTPAPITPAPAKSGWQWENGKWYFYENGARVIDRFIDYRGETYYVGGDGAMATGWKWLEGTYYYFDQRASGAMVKNKWVYDQGDWYYMGGDGPCCAAGRG